VRDPEYMHFHEVGAPASVARRRLRCARPTGAALIASAADGFGAMPPMRPSVVGSGAGARDIAELPNLLRLVIGAESRCAATLRPPE
jgi:pyridinium-3,5-bisthiocarboxylic acid mononucleotide nickel chelatase